MLRLSQDSVTDLLIGGKTRTSRYRECVPWLHLRVKSTLGDISYTAELRLEIKVLKKLIAVAMINMYVTLHHLNYELA